MAIFFSSVMFLGVIESCKICKHKVESLWFSWFFGLRWPMEAGSRSERNVGKPWEDDLFVLPGECFWGIRGCKCVARNFTWFCSLCLTYKFHVWRRWWRNYHPAVSAWFPAEAGMFAWHASVRMTFYSNSSIAYQSWTSKRFRGRFHQGSAQFRRHFENMSFKKCGVELSGVSTSWDTLWVFAPIVALGYMENSCSKQF